MAASKPKRPAPSPGAALVLPRVSDEQTQRALDKIKVTATQLQAQIGSVKTGTLVGRQVFTASGSYTPTPGTTQAVIRMCGGGGGGGGASAAGVTLSVAAGGGGGVALEVALSSVTSGGSITIGIGGAGGVAAAGTGGTGGDTVVTIDHAVYTARGGLGGVGGSQSGVIGFVPGGDPQAGSTPGIPQSAWAGMDGVLYGVAGGGVGYAGVGAGSLFGSPGRRGGTNAVPTSPDGYGSGGAGAASANSTNTAGGQGAPGLVLIEEYA